MLRLACLWMMASFTGAAAAQPAASIQLLPHATVGADAVLLGQVARVRSEDLDLIRALVHLPVARLPAGAHVLQLDRRALTRQVERLGARAANVAWSGADLSVVERPMQRLSGDRLAEVAMGSLRSALQQQGMQSNLQVLTAPRDLQVPAGDVELRARPVHTPPLARRALVWIEVRLAGAPLRLVPVPVQVDNHSFDAHPARRSTAAGARGTIDTVPPLVLRGQFATLRSGGGAVLLETRVEVLQDGHEGQKVRVRQQGATGMVLGRVTGPGELELAP